MYNREIRSRRIRVVRLNDICHSLCECSGIKRAFNLNRPTDGLWSNDGEADVDQQPNEGVEKRGQGPAVREQIREQ